MKQIIKKTNRNIPKLASSLAIIIMMLTYSCDDFELPEAGSIADLTPPVAGFEATQGVGANDEWKIYSFANLSSGATDYLWDFGNGSTSTDLEPFTTFPGEGSFTVTLTASDKLGVESVFSQVIEVVEPVAAVIPDPVLVNGDFTKQAKNSGSDCACSAWINKSLGAQGESTSGNGGSDNVIKFDNDEHDAAYQEFEVTPNADYTVTLVVGFDSSAGGSFPSVLELRVLAGSGYVSGYTPTYYTLPTEFPQDGFGYTTIAQMEDPVNNLLSNTIAHPNNNSYTTYTYTFNAGNNTSVAFLMRGIGGDGTPSDDKGFSYNNGDEEIQVDSVIITANN